MTHMCLALCSVVALLLFRFPPISSSSSSMPATPEYCGGVQIPYPFVLKSGPYEAAKQGFEVGCTNLPPIPLLTVGGRSGRSGLQILEVSLDQGFVRVAAEAIAKHCSGVNSSDVVTNSSSWIDLTSSPFTFSDTMNKFTVIGCDALAMISRGDKNSTRGCVAFCDSEDGALDQSCSGIGCCQAAIPPGLQSFGLKLRSIDKAAAAGGGGAFDDTCNKAFLMQQQDQFNFDTSLLDMRKPPLVLEWVIGKETCTEEASSSGAESYACKNNAECYNSSSGIGYRCRCKKGYSGNPYLTDGCQDIDECQAPGTNDCIGDCINIPGGFRCKCPKGMTGDGKKSGSGCTKSKENQLKATVGIVVGIFCLLVLLGSISSFWVMQKRRTTKLKELFFRQNGGLLLQKQISENGSAHGTRIFTMEEVEKATDNFGEHRILGRGGQGTVYKGILPDKRTVAIKKSRISDDTQIEQFINEVIILSKIDHPNVVKLLGCCLETQVPLLVYEFVSNGALFDHIHGEKCPSTAPLLTWGHRLRIAAETAGALAYLHTAASIPIIHRDVKSANILLDGNFTARVSDFGASRSVPFDRTHVTTLVQGTLGYLDPEYFQTSQLTEKSDVYSFGVVLAELLTGQKPVSCFRTEEERNLASYFITKLEARRLREVLEAQMLEEAGREHLGVVARLARRCLSLRGEDRPSMKEVAMELKWAMRFLKKGVDMGWNGHGRTDQGGLVGEEMGAAPEIQLVVAGRDLDVGGNPRMDKPLLLSPG